MIIKNTKNKFSLLIAILAIYSLSVTPFARALEIEITDNGSGSESEVAIQQTTTTEVNQTNNSETSNTVTVDANTGNNSANDNSGGSTEIITGDTNTQVTIENVANTSAVDSSDCCTENSTILIISGNGSGSINQIDTTSSSTTNIAVSQNASVKNTINGYINTGGNTANDNTGGNVSITTGSIKVTTNLVNGPINTSNVKLPTGLSGLTAKISGNGSDSINLISAKLLFTPTVSINNYSDINNFLTWDLNTGNNEANGNTGGDVNINTGDIDLGLFISNLVNLSNVEISCCSIFDPGDDDPDDEEDPGDEEDEDDGDGDEDEENGSIPAGAEVGAGGPGVLGLSDTSSGEFQSLLFMIGLATVAFGLKFVGEGLTSTNLAKRSSLR